MKTPYRIMYKKSWGYDPYLILIQDGKFISSVSCSADGRWTGGPDYTQWEVNAMCHLKCANPPEAVIKLAEWMIKP
jgi:hypothetical protein